MKNFTTAIIGDDAEVGLVHGAKLLLRRRALFDVLQRASARRVLPTHLVDHVVGDIRRARVLRDLRRDALLRRPRGRGDGRGGGRDTPLCSVLLAAVDPGALQWRRREHSPWRRAGC